MPAERRDAAAADGLLKGFAVLLAVPLLGLGLWLFPYLGSFAGNVVAPGVPPWWRLFMLAAILIPVSAGFGLVQALANRWVPAGAWFLVMGAGAAVLGTPGRLVGLASAGLGTAMLIRAVEARPRRTVRISAPSVPVWNRGLAVAGLGVAALALVFGVTGLRTGHGMSPHPDAGLVTYLSSGVALLPLTSALLLWRCQRAQAVLVEVLAAAMALATPHYVDTWPYPAAPGSPEASLGVKMQVLGVILLVFAGVVFVWSLLARPPAPAHATPPEAPPRTDSPISKDARRWTRTALGVLMAILLLGGASYGLRAYGRSRGVERVADLERDVRQEVQACAASAAERIPYEPHDDRPLFSEHFTGCMREYDVNLSCTLSISIRWCDINTGAMSGSPPSGPIDIGPYVDAALVDASGEPYDRPGESAYGRIDQASIPLPPSDLTGQLKQPLSRAVTIARATGMKGEPAWIQGVLVAQPHLGHRVLFCPQVEIRLDGVEKSIHCSSGLIPEDGVIWTDAERSFVGTIEDGAPRIVRWKDRGPERIQDCVFDDHLGTAPDSEVGSCRELDSRYGPTRNFFTLYTEVYGRVVGKPRSMWTDPYLADHGLWRRNKGYALLAARPGDTR